MMSHRRRWALEMLADAGQRGRADLLFLAWFTPELLDLVEDGLATVWPETASGRTVEAARVRITGAGRRAIKGPVHFPPAQIASPSTCAHARPSTQPMTKRVGVVDRWNTALAVGRGVLWSPTIRFAVLAVAGRALPQLPDKPSYRHSEDIRTVDRHPARIGRQP